MVKGSEIIFLSDRVILNIITDNPNELLKEMRSFFEAKGNTFPISDKSLLITEEQKIKLSKNVLKTLYKTPLLTITVSDGNIGIESASIQLNQEEVFNLI